MGRTPPAGDRRRSSLPPGFGTPSPPVPPALTTTGFGGYQPGGRSRRWWAALPVALFVYFALALVTLAQPCTVAGLSLSVPVPGLLPTRVFSLPDRPFIVMIVGLDARPSEEGGPARTDSILLLRIDPAKNRAGILSIPRDSMMEVPYDDGTYTRDRINTAYVYNWSESDKSAAPDALAATIEHNLGLHVDYHIIFNQRAAAKIIDAAGGVTVNVREAFGQDNYSDDDVHVVPQYFSEGKHHLDGYSAVAYGRIREGSSDFDRIRRQQQVAEGLVAQLSSPLRAWRLPKVWSAYRGNIDTDLNRRQSMGLFMLLKRAGTDRIATRSLGDAAVSCTWCTAAILQLLPDETARIVGEAFNNEGLGEQAAQLLVAAGVTP